MTQSLVAEALAVPPVVPICGLGDPSAQFLVYIDKRPSFSGLALTNQVQALSRGEIHAIGQACGNGWRKVFNLYAKLIFALGNEPFSVDHQNEPFPVDRQSQTWQQYREQTLLQPSSNTALLFSEPSLKQDKKLHVVMGRSYAKSLTFPSSLTWLDNEFALAPAERLIVCPYFDYRQLSNIKLIRLVTLIGDINREITSPSPIKLA